MKCVHFTDIKNIERFQEGKSLQKSFPGYPAWYRELGLRVYAYNPEAIGKIQCGWPDRRPIIIEINEKFVELLQKNPLNDDPDWDEYLIRAENFGRSVVLSAWHERPGS